MDIKQQLSCLASQWTFAAAQLNARHRGMAQSFGSDGDARRAKALDSAQALLSVFTKYSKPAYSFAPPEPPPLWARQTATPKRSPFQFAAWPWRHLPAPLCKWWYKAGQ
ncbi:MAG: hypothetical protein RIB61_19010 [Roseicyclus sp.]